MFGIYMLSFSSTAVLVAENVREISILAITIQLTAHGRLCVCVFVCVKSEIAASRRLCS